MRRFARLKASNYVFHDTDGDRKVIALFAGSRKLAFIKYEALDKLIGRLNALKHQHAQEEGHEDLQEPPLSPATPRTRHLHPLLRTPHPHLRERRRQFRTHQLVRATSDQPLGNYRRRERDPRRPQRDRLQKRMPSQTRNRASRQRSNRMTRKRGKPHARHTTWRDGDQIKPVIKIYSGPVYALIPYSEGRRVVDEVHDLCDAYEREQRAEPGHN